MHYSWKMQLHTLLHKLLNKSAMHAVISLLLQSMTLTFWWYLLLTSSMLLHNVIMTSYCCQRYAECQISTLFQQDSAPTHCAHTCNSWTAASRNAKLSYVQAAASKQPRSHSVLWIMRSRLSCSIMSTTDKSIVWMNWNWCGLEQSIFDETIDQWQGRHRVCVHAKERHFENNLWSDNVDFVHICYIPFTCDLFDCYIFNVTKSCQQCWPIHSCSFYKVVH